jgi:predicted ATPase/signal transduction histidine kinase
VVIGELHRSSRYVVSRTQLTDTGPLVIVKAVRADQADATAAARLRQEYDLLASLDIAGVVRPIAFEPVAGHPALILEDAGPQSLKEWMHRRELSPESFLDLAGQLAEALVGLHGRRIIHRDINPWNVVVDPRQRATLVDFEAATRVPGLEAHAGVPARLDAELSYVAPEETGRTNRLVDQRADLYSLGAVLYELLTGRAPFVSADPVQLIHAHLARAPVPPSQANPSVPAVLSDIVLRLLAKMPEARYQSARALREDLREARARLEPSGRIAPFELGLIDLADELPLPERLYQREEQRRALLSAWRAAAAGETAVAVLAGPGGIGKSTLAFELEAPVAAQDGRFITAKFDAQRGRAPYAPFAEAFRGLVTELLRAPAAQIAAWRQRIEHALGENARAIADLAPELERLIGTPPAMPAVGAVETESRFHLAVQAFMRALASAERPMVLFLDDLQWADPASLRLLEFLAGAPDLPGLLIVLALRPEECGAEDEVTKTLSRLSATPAFVRIELPALTRDGVVELCREALRCEADRALPLATLLLEKTAGNPFFVRRMLRFLHQSGLLVFDPGARTWTWDLAAIERVDVAENVVDLLLTVLRRLPDPVRALLESAACIGNTVPLRLLAAVRRVSPAEASQALWAAVHAGLLVPQAPAGEAGTDALFRFAHDRVRQAAYVLSGEAARKAIHLEVGRQLLREAPGEQALDEQIYAIVDQLDRGLDLVTDPAERWRLSQLNLRAARKARGSSAYGPALEYIKCALALLPAGAWESNQAETFALHRDAVQFAGYAGDLALARELFERAVAHAASPLEKADLYSIRMYASIAQFAREEAFTWGQEGVRLFGIELPLDDPQAATARELEAIAKNLSGRKPAELLEAPRMQRPEQLACMELLCTLLDVTFFVRPDLFPFVATRMVNMSLEHGHAASSAQAYAAYAVLLGMTSQDYHTAHAFGRLSVDLAARFGDPLRELRVMAVFTTSVNSWTAPLHTNSPLCRIGQARAFTAGDTYFAAAFSLTDVMVRLHQGVELGELARQLQASIARLRAARSRRGVEEHLVFLQAVRTLQGSSLQDEDVHLAGAALDERGLPAGVTEESGKLPEYEILRLGVACHLRDFARARELSAAVAPDLNRVPRFVQRVEHNFYSSIALAARGSHAAAEEKEALLATIARNQEQLGLWARNGPENYRHKHLIVAAELARLEGRAAEAADLYDQAITAARSEEFLQDEALASELCGRFYLAQGRRRIAWLYLSAAIDGYARWGAKAKVDALEEEFVALTVAEEGLGARGERGPTHDRTGGVALDLLAVLRGAEAVSSEVRLPRMLGKLMEVCLATAGAERGAFVVEEDGQLFVRAVGTIGEPISLQDAPLEDSSHLPSRVVREVARTRETLVVGDASTHEGLPADPYLAEHGIRSLLALPIVRQTKLMGVLYLENNLATRAFTPERVRLLNTLSSQIATSLQNSLLFEQLQQENEERRRAEAAVRFLADAGAALAESLDYQTTLKKLTRLAVPVLADWCAVHVVQDGLVHWVAAAHVDPAKQRVLEENVLREVGGALPRHVTEVLESGGPVLHTRVDRAVLERYLSRPEDFAVVDAIGAESSMILPLRAHGRFLGAMTLASNVPDRRFSAPDLAAAEELARRAASAIDNARLYREAQDAIRLRDEFLSIASHELNTPIASMKMMAQTFEGATAVPSLADFTRVMSLIGRQSQRLATLVSGLLDVTQIPAGNFKLRLEPVELAGLVRETVDLFRGDLEKAGCRLVLSADAHLTGRWDRMRLQQVVANLLSNAIKFAPGKDIEVTVASAGDSRARLVVADHGMGVPPERLPHIFGRFERAVSASHYGGLGLGLYVVHAVVKALGGTVSVASALGQGSTFTVELPLDPGPA